MPNWCSNWISITGSPSEIARFVEKAKGVDEPSGQETVFSFQSIHPMPECRRTQLEQSKDCWARTVGGTGRVERSEEEMLSDAWYYWHIQHWGTKWDILPTQWCLESPENLQLNVSTAWSPPVGVIEKACELFPELTFHVQYYELGCDFAGELTSTGNTVAHEEGGPRDFDFSREVLEELEEFED